MSPALKLAIAAGCAVALYSAGFLHGGGEMKKTWDAAELARSESARDRLAEAAEAMVKTYQQTQELVGDLEDDPDSVPLGVVHTLDGMRERQDRNGKHYTYSPPKD